MGWSERERNLHPSRIYKQKHPERKAATAVTDTTTVGVTSEATPTAKKAAAKRRAAKSTAKKATPAKASAKKAPSKRKAPAKPQATAPVDTSDVKVITPDDEGFDRTIGGRGKRDVVSPVMDVLLDEQLAAGNTTFQLPDGEPFSVSQVRNWANRRHADPDTFPLGYERISVGGGNGKNIHISLKPVP